jgi:hypothetical protein
MANATLKQLKHADPEKRIAAIKAVAKAKDRDALITLARMSKDDRSAEVRDLAQKAGAYILKETGGLREHSASTKNGSAPKAAAAPPPMPLDDKGKLKRIPVSEQQERQAQKLMDDAFTFNVNGDPSKAMKSLMRALLTNPNLRDEAFFVSLAETITGEQGEAAIQKLYNRQEMESATRRVHESKLQKAVDQHREETEKTGWEDVLFDIALLGVLLCVAVVVLGMLLAQNATGYVDRWEQNQTDLNQARAAGRCSYDEELLFRCYHELTQADIEQRKTQGEEISPMNPAPGFMGRERNPESETFLGTARELSVIGFPDALRVGALVGAAGAALMVIANAIAHLISKGMFKGIGTLPHLAHQVTSMLLNRVVLTGILGGIAVVLTFSTGGGVVMQGAAGVIGVFLLTVLLSIAAKAGQSYNLGFFQGLIAALAGLLVAAPIAFGVGITLL